MKTRQVREFEVENAGADFSTLAAQFRGARQALGTLKSATGIELLLQEAEANRRLGNDHAAAQLFATVLHYASRPAFAFGECWANWGLGMVMRSRGRYGHCRLYFRRAYASASCAGDVRCMLWSRAELAETDRITGDYRAALSAHLDLRTAFREIGDARGVSWAISGIAQMLRITGSLTAAMGEFTIALDLSQTAGDLLPAAWSLRGLAEIAREQKQYERALILAEKARGKFDRLGYKLGVAYAEKTLADSLLAAGKLQEANAMAMACTTHFSAVGEARGIALALLTSANVSAATGDATHAIHEAKKSAMLMTRTAVPAPPGFDPRPLLYRLMS